MSGQQRNRIKSNSCAPARDRAIENSLYQQAGPACDALTAAPSRAVTVDQVHTRLAAEHVSFVMDDERPPPRVLTVPR